ncbi:MAG: antibiotic biosynthesis monooxygenase family protein [Steroidobacteraceae bacterium]
MTIAVVVELSVKPEHSSDIAAGLAQTLAVTRGFAGCLGIQGCRHDSVPHRFVMLEHWESRAHYERYLEWRKQTGMMEQMGGVLADVPSTRIMDVIA